MHFHHKPLAVLLSLVGILTLIAVPAAPAQPAPAVYQGVQPDSFMTRWLVLGPIPVFDDAPDPEDQASQKDAFGTDYLHPTALGAVASGQAHEIKGTSYSWQPVRAKEEVVDLSDTFGEVDFVAAYAWAEIEMPEDQTVLLAVGSDDAVKVWLNGEVVHENWIARPLTPDEDLFPVPLKQGKNELLLKVQDMQYDWSFSCRVLGSGLFPDRLVASAGRGDLDALGLLLAHGGEVNAPVAPGLTALHAARIHGREEAARLLLDHGADPGIAMPPKAKLAAALFEKAIEGEAPGAAVLVAQNGDVLFEQGFGLASLEHRVPVTADTKFRIGSITKQFTAAAILKLQEAGLLGVADPLSRFIPDFPRGDEVTLHHLLTHTSGIHSYTDDLDFMETVAAAAEPEDLVETIKGGGYDFDPGESWHYNNSGYFLLGYIVEKVSGESYADYLRHTFFEPLGMNDTGVHTPSAILEHEAAGYSYLNGAFQKARYWDMSRAGGAGALYSTVGDLFRWNEAVFAGEVLSQESLDAAFTPVTLDDGNTPTTIGGGYGYGWVVVEFRGLKEIQHSGGFDGFVAQLSRFPEQRLTVAVLTNAAPARDLNPGQAAYDLAQIYLWDVMDDQASFSTDASVDAGLYDDYVGGYEYPGGAILIVTREGDRLFAQLPGQPRFEIFPRSETEFFWKVVDAQVTFVRNDAGVVTHAVHRQAGQVFEAPKREEEKPAAIDPALYADYTGEYELRSDFILTVTSEGERLFVQATGQPKLELFPRSETAFFLKMVQAEIRFVRDEGGQVTSLVLHQGGIDQKAQRRTGL